MPRAPDFFAELSADELKLLEAFAREPGRTVDQCVDWLEAHGVTQVSRSAVGRWKQKFDANDKLRAASELAADVLETAKQSGSVGIGDAATHTLSQLLFESLLRMQGQDQVKSGELLKLSMALKNAMQTKSEIDELRAKGREQMEQLKSAAKARAITPEMIDQVSKAVFG